MSTNINFNKHLGITRLSGITLPSSSTPAFSNTKSILLDGVDDYIEIGSPTSIQSLTSAITISAWIKAPRTFLTQQYTLASKGEYGASGAQWTIQIYTANASNTNGGYFQIFPQSNGITDRQTLAFPTAIDDNQWHHIMCVNDGTDLKIYLDGVLDATGAGKGRTLYNGNRTLRLGRLTASSNNKLIGNLDEVAIFGTALGLTEAQTIYNGGVPNDISSLSPVSWWRFEGSGTTAIDSGSGSNNGTLINGVTRSTNVPPNPFVNTKSILLDGIDDFVNVADNNNLSFGNGVTDSPFSISAWVKMNDATKFRAIGKYGATNVEYLFATGGDDKIVFNLYDNSTGARIGRKYDTTLTSYEGQWIHLVATYNGNSSTSGLKIYLNGSRVDDTNSTLGTYVAMENTTQPFYIGKLTTTYADGNVDETAVFNTELSASDITTIYNGGEPNDISSLSPLSWWRCGDGDTAPTLTDNGSGGNNGTMTNFSTFSTDVPTAPSFTNTKSIALDGVDDYVSFSQVTYTGEFTTSFWIKPDVLGSSFLVGRQANSDYVWLRTVAQIRIRINFSTYIFSEGSGNNINIGAWNHLLISRDSSNNVSIFLNGASFSTSQVGAGDHRLDQIGKVVTSYYDGNVDETAFWDSDQSSNLATIYNSGVPNDISSLSPTLWYRMGDGDTSPTITDNGSSSNNGTMTNFTTFSTDVPT